MNRFEVETLFENDKRSVARILLDGVGRRVVNGSSTNTYHVAEGFVTFTVTGLTGNKVTTGLGRGAHINIRPGETYYNNGEEVVMYCLSEPPFDPTQVTVVE